jgi:hypothetical protein
VIIIKKNHRAIYNGEILRLDQKKNIKKKKINVSSIIITRATLFSSNCFAYDLSPLRNTNLRANSVILDHSYKLSECSVETTDKKIEKIRVGKTNIPEFL